MTLRVISIRDAYVALEYLYELGFGGEKYLKGGSEKNVLKVPWNLSA
jgi:hypothetical protein